MSWLRTKNQKPDYTSLQIQTSTSTLPIPIVWGQNKIAPNVIWYTNFQSSDGGGHSGKGGLFRTNSNTTTYSADLIMALCEGQVGGIGYIWRDQSTYALADLGLTFFEGTSPQSDWSYLTSNYPNQALAYQGTAYVCAASYQLGTSADVGNHNFEILGLGQSSGANGIDCDPAFWVYDFLTNSQYGAGFDPSLINGPSLFTSSGGAHRASLQSYCSALGIAISPCLTTQEPASSILQRVLEICNSAGVWSQGQLKFIPYGDQAIGAGDITNSVLTAVPAPATTSAGGVPPPSIVVCGASAWVSDGGVVYTFTGSSLTYTGTNPPTATGTYTISPNGTYVFATGDEGSAITITYTYAIATAYTPNVTPAYSLFDGDFLLDGNEDPVKASRVDPFSLPNIIRLDVLSRSNRYSGTIVEARDQSQIELYGPRVGSTITAHEICDDVTIAPIVAQTILQRQLYVRAHYTFKLGLEYCLLDPMDILEITDANLGLSAYPVRITSIEEDDKGDLTVTAEELVFGISHPAANPSRGVQGYQPNQAYPADAVTATPLIFEPPPGLTNGASQIWLGASGGTGTAADPNWGGCNVWISLDNTTYTEFGQITAPMRQGVLTANLASASGWDTTNTLAVNLTESAGALTGTSQASAQQGATLCLIDSELLAYETATLSSAYHYNVTGLARGLYGTSGASHSSAAAFYRLDSSILQATLSSQYIGQTLYFKFQSYNVFGTGEQQLSACTAYSYTPVGAANPHPIIAQLNTGMPVDLGAVTIAAAVFDDLGSVVATDPVIQITDLGFCH